MHRNCYFSLNLKKYSWPELNCCRLWDVLCQPKLGLIQHRCKTCYCCNKICLNKNYIFLGANLEEHLACSKSEDICNRLLSSNGLLGTLGWDLAAFYLKHVRYLLQQCSQCQKIQHNTCLTLSPENSGAEVSGDLPLLTGPD